MCGVLPVKVTVDFPGVNPVVKRRDDGSIVRVYYYHRASGVRLPDDPSSEEFAARYRALNTEIITAPTRRPGSFAALVAQYRANHEFRKLATSTQANYNTWLRLFEDGEFGSQVVKRFKIEHAIELRDELDENPRSADACMAVLSILLSFGKLRGYCAENFLLGLKKINVGSSYLPWSDDQIAAFRAKGAPWAIDAMDLGLYTGQRRSDCVPMGAPHYDGTTLALVQRKTGTRVWMPAHALIRPKLDRWIAEGRFAFLLDANGKPWDRLDSFSKAFGQAVRDAGLPSGLAGCSFHGLRHNAADALIDAGCTPNEAMAITGHQDLRSFMRYVSKRNQRKLAARGMEKWERATVVSLDGGNSKA